MRTAIILTLLTLGAGLAAPLRAQDRFPPAAGSRVRVSSPSQFLDRETGTVLSSDGNGVAVRLEATGERVELPYDEIAWFEVSRGRTRGTLIGAAGGAVLGGLLGVLTTPMPEASLEGPPSGGEGGRFFLGAILGGFVGGVIGSTVQVERWDPVFTAWPYGGGAGGDDGAGFLVSVSF